MKISIGWKILLHIFVAILLIQGLDFAYYLLNQRDTYLANFGVVVAGIGVVATVDCLVRIVRLSMQYIKEVEQKQK